MSQRTDQSSSTTGHELSNEYLLTLGGVTLGTLLVIFGIENWNALFDSSRVHMGIVFAYPWTMAGGITISNALDFFSGNPSPVQSGIDYWVPLFGLVLVGVIGFTLFLLLMKSGDPRDLTSHRTKVLYVLGLILSSTFATTMVPITITHRINRSNIRDAQAVQRNKDMIINELNEVAWRLREHRILPARFGGGGGDVRSFKIDDIVEKSPYATYHLDWDGDVAVVIAQSLPYEDATVRARIDTDGKLGDWSYTGRFN